MSAASNQTTLVELKGLAVGMWKRRPSLETNLYLISPPLTAASNMFVFLNEQHIAHSSTHGFIGAHSPFSSALYKGRGCVFAFEVLFADIEGIDYENQLLQPGRLVIEGRNVRKREFSTLNDSVAFYLSRDISNVPNTPVNGKEHIDNGHKWTENQNSKAKTNLASKLEETANGVSFKANGSHASESADTPKFSTMGNGTAKAIVEITDDSHMKHVASAPNLHTPGNWPSPCVFTRTVHVFRFRQITIWFEDPGLPGALKPVIESNEKLLKLYESGLPLWAIMMPYYGFYYRPWFRSVTWWLFYAFSIFSLAAGFYDLFKTLPGLQALLSKTFSAVWLPGAALLEWLETHAQIRLSILLTYIFGKSELFVLVMRWLSNFFRIVRTAALPLTQIIEPPLIALSSGARLFAGQTGAVLWTLMQTVLTPLLTLYTAVHESITTTLAPILVALYTVFVQPASWFASVFVQLQTTLVTLWATAVQAGRTVSAGRQITSSASSTWASAFASSEAFTVLKDTLIRASRSAQAVWKALTAMIGSLVRHRMTLKRRGKRQWMRVKQRIGQLAMIPVHALISLIQLMIMSILLLFGEGKKPIRGNSEQDLTRVESLNGTAKAKNDVVNDVVQINAQTDVSANEVQTEDKKSK